MEHETQNGISTHSHRKTSRGHDLSLTEIVQEQPITSLAVAIAAGFILGGGVRRTHGLALLMLLGQMAMRDAVGNIVNGALGSDHGG
jgi:hypothetical protein